MQNLAYAALTPSRLTERILAKTTICRYLVESKYVTISEATSITAAVFADNGSKTLADCIGRTNVPFANMTCEQVLYASFQSVYVPQDTDGFIFSVVSPKTGKMEIAEEPYLPLPWKYRGSNHFQVQVSLPKQEEQVLTPEAAWLLEQTGGQFSKMPLNVPVRSKNGNIIFVCPHEAKDGNVPVGASNLFDTTDTLGFSGLGYYFVLIPDLSDKDTPNPFEYFFRELHWVNRQSKDKKGRVRRLMSPYTGLVIRADENKIDDEPISEIIGASRLDIKWVDKNAWTLAFESFGIVKSQQPPPLIRDLEVTVGRKEESRSLASVTPKLVTESLRHDVATSRSVSPAVIRKKAGRPPVNSKPVMVVDPQKHDLLFGGQFAGKNLSVCKESFKGMEYLRLYANDEPTIYGTANDDISPRDLKHFLRSYILPGQLSCSQDLLLKVFHRFDTQSVDEILKMCARPLDFTRANTETKQEGKKIRVTIRRGGGEHTFLVKSMKPAKLEQECRVCPMSDLIKLPLGITFWNLWHKFQGDATKMELATRIKEPAPPAPVAPARVYSPKDRQILWNKIASFPVIPGEVLQMAADFITYGQGMDDEPMLDMDALSNAVCAQIDEALDKLAPPPPPAPVSEPTKPKKSRHEKPAPTIEELKVLAHQTQANTEAELKEVTDGLKQLAGKVTETEYQIGQAAQENYEEFALDPKVLEKRVKQQLEAEVDDDDDSNTVSSEEEVEEGEVVVTADAQWENAKRADAAQQEAKRAQDERDALIQKQNEERLARHKALRKAGEEAKAAEEAAKEAERVAEREAKRAEKLRQRQEEQAIAALQPQARVIQRAYEDLDRLLWQQMTDGGEKTFDVIAGLLYVRNKDSGREIACVPFMMEQSAIILKQLTTYTTGELVRNPTLFWHAARLSFCNERVVRGDCASYATLGDVTFSIHDDGRTLGITQEGRYRTIANLDITDKKAVSDLLAYCSSKTMEQLMDEPGSTTFWQLMRYCHLKGIPDMTMCVINAPPAVQRKYLQMSAILGPVDPIETIETSLWKGACNLVNNTHELNTNDCDELLEYLQRRHDLAPLPQVQYYHSHWFDHVERNGYQGGIPAGKQLLVFVIHEPTTPKHYYTMAYNVQHARFFIFDSMPRPVSHYQSTVDRIHLILNGPQTPTVMMVQGPVQTGLDCGLFAMSAVYLLTTSAWTDLVRADPWTMSLSVTEAWFTADQIAAFRGQLFQHLMAKHLLFRPTPGFELVVQQEVEINEHGKRTRQEEPEEQQVCFTEVE